jgi:glucokinase
MSWGIGIDLGGTNVKAVAVTSEGEVLGQKSVPTRDGVATIETWADAARLAIADFVRERGAEPAAVGMCMPGLVGADGRSIVSYPGRLRGLEGFDWTAALNRPRVPLLNDAHAALLAEAWLGAAKGRRHAILLTLGTGVGGAILSDGRLLRGALGRAGHLGHMTVDHSGPASIVGMPGAIEMMIGECTLRERCGGRYADTQALVAAYWAGDQEATHIWLKSVRALACAISSAINVLDPEIVVLGGGIAKAGEALFRPLREELAKVEWRPNGRGVPVVPAALGEWAGALGAARHALQS